MSDQKKKEGEENVIPKCH